MSTEESQIGKNPIKDFLIDLTKLSLKHRIIISGCHCCGSPWLETLGGNHTWLTDCLHYNEELEEYVTK